MVDYEIDQHEILDLSAKIQIILQGLKYAIFFKDIDTLRKAAMIGMLN